MPNPDLSHSADQSLDLDQLSASARAALWHLQEWLRGTPRSPIYAVIAPPNNDRQRAALALCKAEQGKYLDLVAYIRDWVLSDDGFRMEWLTPGYLANLILRLAHACTDGIIVVDGLESFLGMFSQANPDAAVDFLRDLIYRSPAVPVILLLSVGPASYHSVYEIRSTMESEGRQRVVELEPGLQA